MCSNRDGQSALRRGRCGDRCVGERGKLLKSRIVRKDLPSFDLVDPAVQVQLATRKSGSNRRVRSKVFELCQYVLLNAGRNERRTVKIGIVLLHRAPRRVRVREPLPYRRRIRHERLVEEPLHGAAV